MMRRNFSRQTRRAAGSLSVAACALALASCTSVTRIPYTQQEQAAAVIPGIQGARVWADDPAVATVRRLRRQQFRVDRAFLAPSALPKIKHTAALFTRTITTRRDLCNGLSEKKGRAACDLE